MNSIERFYATRRTPQRGPSRLLVGYAYTVGHSGAYASTSASKPLRI